MRKKALEVSVLRTVLALIAMMVMASGDSTLYGDETTSKSSETVTVKEASIIPSWTRRFRDTFVLTQEFTNHFRGTPEETVSEFRKELALTMGSPVDDVSVELDRDKRTLTVEFKEKRAPEVEPAIVKLLQKNGWWDDRLKERQQAVDRALRSFREEVLKQRALVEEIHLEAAQVRAEAGIIDPDIEDPKSVFFRPNEAALEQLDATNRYTELKTRYLQARRILEAAELRYSTESMNRGVVPGLRE